MYNFVIAHSDLKYNYNIEIWHFLFRVCRVDYELWPQYFTIRQPNVVSYLIFQQYTHSVYTKKFGLNQPVTQTKPCYKFV